MTTLDGLEIYKDAVLMRQFSRQQRRSGRTIAFVPTMGNLHDGHIALVEAARQHADIVVASIYVNPTQFSKNEDFDKYPQQRQKDHQMLRDAGCTAVFEPASLYFSPSQRSESSAVVGKEDHVTGAHETYVQAEALQQGLCGQSRPAFFRGVATVVCKLFNIVEPDVAVFGKKDYQQWRVLERMARDLDFGITIIALPTVRCKDGLAMSSRNCMLTADHRSAATCIFKALQWAARQAAVKISAEGDGADALPEELRSGIEARLQDSGAKVDYIEVVDAEELRPVDTMQQPVLIAVAVWFGDVRLIDNIVIEPTGSHS